MKNWHYNYLANILSNLWVIILFAVVNIADDVAHSDDFYLKNDGGFANNFGVRVVADDALAADTYGNVEALQSKDIIAEDEANLAVCIVTTYILAFSKSQSSLGMKIKFAKKNL